MHIYAYEYIHIKLHNLIYDIHLGVLDSYINPQDIPVVTSTSPPRRQLVRISPRWRHVGGLKLKNWSFPNG